MNKKYITGLLFGLVCIGILLIPVFLVKTMWYPYATSKAWFLQSVILACLPFYVYLFFIDKSLRPNLKNPLTLSVLGFTCISLLSGFFGENSSRSFWGMYQRMTGNFELVHFVLLYFYILLVAKSDDNFLEKILKLLTWVGFASALYGILEKVFNLNWFPDPSFPSRISGSFGSPTFYASFLIIPFFLSCFFATRSENKNKIFYLVSAFFIALATYFTGTRGAFLGLVLSGVFLLVVYFFEIKKYLKFTQKKWLAFFTLLILGVLLAVKISTSSRLANFQDGNSKARLIQWGMVFKGFKDSPLFGVGPENYNIIANKYFNTELYKFDDSSFDKPHNYLLEILSTTGALGLLAYLCILVFFVKIVLENIKNKTLTTLSGYWIIGGLFAYQVQNFFAFEVHVSALTFYILLAFVGYLKEISFQEENNKIENTGTWLAVVLTTITLVFCIIIFVFYNMSLFRVMKITNYAFSDSQTNPEVANLQIENIFNNNFVYSKGEVLQEISKYTINLAEKNTEQNKQKINDLFNNAIVRLVKFLQKTNNDPIYLTELAKLKIYQSIYNSQPVPEDTEEIINKATDLAPGRVEPLELLLQIKISEGKYQDVSETAKIISNIKPSKDTYWLIAVANVQQNNLNDAVIAAEKAIELGYEFKTLTDIAWLINYYTDLKDYVKVIELDKKAVILDPQNKTIFKSLSDAYLKLGKIKEAEQILKNMPK